ncbi:hypothetical protein [Nocardia fluminea]|uniref:hypothetical protein n=1 Tax=Nocardia fluminea TaxID=134984 RepID=UPI003D0AFB0E
MSEAYERMKRIRAQQAQDAQDVSAQTRQAAAGNERKLQAILSDLVEIFGAEGVRPTPVYLDTGRTLRYFKQPIQTYRSTGISAWTLAPATWSIDEPVGTPAVTTNKKLISTMWAPLTDPTAQIRGLDQGPGFIEDEKWKRWNLTPYRLNESGRAIQLLQLTEDDLAAFYLETVEANRKLGTD